MFLYAVMTAAIIANRMGKIAINATLATVS